jgi:hypothetical protein
MHRLLLSSIAVLAILAIITGGRGDPALRRADPERSSADARAARHIAVAMTDTASWWR